MHVHVHACGTSVCPALTVDKTFLRWTKEILLLECLFFPLVEAFLLVGLLAIESATR